MRGEKLYFEAKLLHKKMYEYPSKIPEKNKTALYKQYFDLIKKAAYVGNVEAQYDLGQQYETTNYLHIQNPMYSPRKCIYWYTKACLKNHPEACNSLGSFYESGEGLEKDLKKALSLYKKSADLGYSIGKKNYTIMQRQLKGL